MREYTASTTKYLSQCRANRDLRIYYIGYNEIFRVKVQDALEGFDRRHGGFFFRHVRISVVEPTPQATQQHIGRTQWRGDRENKAAS